MSNANLLGRRNFIKGLGAATGVAMVSPVMAVSEKADGIKWDKEIEILIVGSGFAGLAAAIEATRKGAKDVHIFEKMSYFGGNSAINGGLFAAPGTPMQKKKEWKIQLKKWLRIKLPLAAVLLTRAYYGMWLHMP